MANQGPPQIEIAVHGDVLAVKREFTFAAGTIALDLSFRVPGVPNPTVGRIHVTAIQIALQHLEAMLQRAEAEDRPAQSPAAN